MAENNAYPTKKQTLEHAFARCSQWPSYIVELGRATSEYLVSKLTH